MINRLLAEMIKYYSGDAKRIQHFIKVHSFAKMIGELEEIDKNKQFILECAAIVHDIGIKECEIKYNSCAGKLQEKEGPQLAERLLTSLSADSAVTDRVCYLVGHHHTYSEIDDIDYQILVEADFLVNFYEDSIPAKNIEVTYNKIFKTKNGREICKNMFGING